MPLIIISGYPTSGKSTRAKQLYEYLSKRIHESSSATAPVAEPSSSSTSPLNPGNNVAVAGAATSAPKYKLHLISDDVLSIPRSVYDLSSMPAHARSANAAEKDARAAVYGAVKRVLGDGDIVILDGLNYIKGWRYQLHCEAKAVRTVSCVVQIGCSVERARGVNERRLRRRSRRIEEEGGEKEGQESGVTRGEEGEEEDEGGEDDAEPYEKENWENLVFRYEEPNPMTRWDSPLFPLIWEDGPEETARIFDLVWESIAGGNRKVVKPNKATIQRNRDVGADYLYVLDRETQDVVKKILEAGVSEGGAVRIAIEDGKEETVDVPAGVGLARLQRLRRAFVGLNRGGIGLEGVGNMEVRGIRVSFSGYLNDTFEREGR